MIFALPHLAFVLLLNIYLTLDAPLAKDKGLLIPKTQADVLIQRAGENYFTAINNMLILLAVILGSIGYPIEEITKVIKMVSAYHAKAENLTHT